MSKPNYIKTPLCPMCGANDALWDDNLESHIICEDCQPSLYKPVKPVYVPLKYKSASIKDFPKKIIKEMKDKSNNFTTNIILYGECDTGKTYLLTAIINYLECDCEFYTTCDLIQKLLDSMKTDTYSKLLDRVKTVDYLILDDIYTDTRTDYKTSTLFQIINNRYINDLPTFVSFNGQLEDLYATDERVARRLTEDAVIMELTTNYKRG